jgi:hypothetical protein
LVRRSLRQHLLSTVVTALSLALAGGLLMSVWVVKRQARATFTGQTGAWDAVLGARGAKLQLVLNALFHLEASPGNVAFADFQTLSSNRAVALAIPIAVGDNYLGYRIVGTLTNLFTEAEPLAAVGLVAYCLAFLPVVFVLPTSAATALVSRSVGAGDLPAARRAAGQCFLVATVLSLIALAIAAAGGGGFVRLLGLPPGSSDLAARYLAIVFPALPLMAAVFVGVAVLRGAGDMTSGLVAMTVVNLVNAAAKFYEMPEFYVEPVQPVQ